MKLFIIVPLCLALGLLYLTPSASADCCKPTKIIFKIAEDRTEDSCGTYGGKYHNHDTCEKRICGNGDGVLGTWCGRGKCNPFGCHCKNGCLSGEPIESFSTKHGIRNFEYVVYA